MVIIIQHLQFKIQKKEEEEGSQFTIYFSVCTSAHAHCVAANIINQIIVKKVKVVVINLLFGDLSFCSGDRPIKVHMVTSFHLSQLIISPFIGETHQLYDQTLGPRSVFLI